MPDIIILRFFFSQKTQQVSVHRGHPLLDGPRGPEGQAVQRDGRRVLVRDTAVRGHHQTQCRSRRYTKVKGQYMLRDTLHDSYIVFSYTQRARTLNSLTEV